MLGRKQKYRVQVTIPPTFVKGDQYKLVRVRKPLQESEKRRIRERCHNRCVYCGSKYDLQYDHVFPHSKGGSNHESNYVLACRSCNMTKGGRVIPGRTTNAMVENFRRERGKKARGISPRKAAFLIFAILIIAAIAN